MTTIPPSDGLSPAVHALMTDPKVIRIYVAVRDIGESLLASPSGLMMCWTMGQRRAIVADAFDLRAALLALAHLDPQRMSGAPASAANRDTAAVIGGQPPARIELRRLVQHHLFLSHTDTLSAGERATHRMAANTLHCCDPREWSDAWQNEPAQVVRGRITMKVAALAALSVRSEPSLGEQLRAAHTILTTTGAIPSAVPRAQAAAQTEWPALA